MPAATPRDDLRLTPPLATLFGCESVLVDSNLLNLIAVRHPAATEAVDGNTSTAAGAAQVSEILPKLTRVFGQIRVEVHLEEFRENVSLGGVQELDRGEEHLFFKVRDVFGDRLIDDTAVLFDKAAVLSVVRFPNRLNLSFLIERQGRHAGLFQNACQSGDAFIEEGLPNLKCVQWWLGVRLRKPDSLAEGQCEDANGKNR